jgi:ABC-2 type transport system permease protein
MAVYKRGYQPYKGPSTPHRTRTLAFPRYAWKRLMEQRLVVIVMLASLFWPLACAAFVYLSNRADLLQGFDKGFVRFLEVKGTFFLIFMNAQAATAVILAALAGPGLVAPDLTNNALPLYFSRPLSRFDYVLGRLLVLVGLLSPVTWIPGLLLFAMQSGMAGWGWFAANWRLGVGLFVGFGVWILLVSLVALACSAYIRWRIVAGALVLAFFFVLGGAAQIVRQILRADWSVLMDPTSSMYRVWCALLGVALPEEGPGALASGAALVVMALLLAWVLERKLRPVEVVS